MATLYDTLGVSETADQETIRRAFRKLAHKYHPDINPDPASHDVMARINDAFRVLSEPSRRMEYDAILAGGIQVEAEDRTSWTPKSPLLVRLEKRIKAHRTPIYGMGYVGKDTLISSSFDNEVCWWSAETGEQLRRQKLDSGVVSTLRPIKGNGVITAGTTGNVLTICKIGERGVESFQTAAADWASCASVSPNGRLLASGSVHNKLTLTDVSTGRTEATLRDHAGSVTAVAWSEDGRFLASGSSDASVKIRDPQTGRTMATLTAVRSTVTAMAFSGDSKYLAVGAADLSVRVFRLTDGQLQKVMFGHTHPIEAMAFHPNGWLFATGARDGKVGLWAASEGIGHLQIEASHKPILCVAFNADGTLLSAGGLDRTARIWRLTVRETE